jgi:hypothetical protein
MVEFYGKRHTPLAVLHFLLSFHGQNAWYECGDGSPLKWEGDVHADGRHRAVNSVAC